MFGRKLVDIVLAILDHRDLQLFADLRRSQTDSRRGAHRFIHGADQFLDGRGNDCGGSQFPARLSEHQFTGFTELKYHDSAILARQRWTLLDIATALRINPFIMCNLQWHYTCLIFARDTRLGVPELENSQMLGWMIVFALMTVLATVMTVAAGPSAGVVSTKLAALVFGLLFLVCVLTSLVRRRT
jgi:hypothetical protein